MGAIVANIRGHINIAADALRARSGGMAQARLLPEQTETAIGLGERTGEMRLHPVGRERTQAWAGEAREEEGEEDGPTEARIGWNCVGPRRWDAGEGEPGHIIKAHALAALATVAAQGTADVRLWERAHRAMNEEGKCSS